MNGASVNFFFVKPKTSNKMPIFPKSNIVYLHIPKTAGTSVEQALAEKEGLVKWPPGPKPHYAPTYWYGHWEAKGHSFQHATWAEIQEVMGKSINDYTVFATVRDPWARIVSEIKFQMTHFALFPGMPSFKTMTRGPFEVYRKTFNQLVKTKLEALPSNPHLDDNHWLPQSAFLKTKAGEIDPSIRLIRFSSLSSGLAKLFGALSLPHTQQSKAIHRSFYKEPKDLFDEEVQKIVQEMYREDFELLSGIE